MLLCITLGLVCVFIMIWGLDEMGESGMEGELMRFLKGIQCRRLEGWDRQRIE